MHATALDNASRFFACYCKKAENLSVLEIGSLNVNGSIRDVAPAAVTYTGADFVEGNGVDVILTDHDVLPFTSDLFDVVVSSSCLEHAQFFWQTFLEMMRVLNPGGVLYLNMPSGGEFHQYPVDSWRFYPDCGVSLVAWANKNGVQCELLESFIDNRAPWFDCVVVVQKNTSPNKQSSTFDSGSILDAHPAFSHARFRSDTSAVVQGYSVMPSMTVRASVKTLYKTVRECFRNWLFR